MKIYIPQWLSKWKPVTFFLFTIFFTSSLIAQIKISGRVTNKDGNGVPSISVYIKNTTFGTSSDAGGNYILIAPLKPGNYVLEFSGVGFKTKESSVRVGGDQNYSVDNTLAEDPLGLDEVILTGTLGRT